MSTAFPQSVARLFWEIDPSSVDLRENRDYVLERVTSRGGWEAVKWLRSSYSTADLDDFLERKGQRLPPRELAYWTLIAGRPASVDQLGGGRPVWAGP